MPFRVCLFGQNTWNSTQSNWLLFISVSAPDAVICFLLHPFLQYFTSRLKDPPMGPTNQTLNQTLKEEDSRSVLEAKFNNVMTLCAMVPLLIFTCLNSFIHQRWSPEAPAHARACVNHCERTVLTLAVVLAEQYLYFPLHCSVSALTNVNVNVLISYGW